MQSGDKLLYSGREENDIHSDGVAILLSRNAYKALISWDPTNERIITARFHSRIHNITIAQVYAPTETTSVDIKSQFYSELDKVLSKTPKGDILICMGDFNAKVGKDKTSYEHAMGKHGVDTRNVNGELFLETCSRHGLVVGGTLFKHKLSHKTTWVSPNRRTENQIDHFCISRKWKHNLCDVRVKRSADIGSDHHLVVAVLQMKVCAIRNVHPQLSTRKFEVAKLKTPSYLHAVENDFNRLIDQVFNPNDGVEQRWNQIKENLLRTCEQILGQDPKGRKEWMSSQTWSLIEERRSLILSKNNEKSISKRIELDNAYSIKNMEVRRACRRDKRIFTDELATQANDAASKNDTKTVYAITRRLTGRHKPTDRPIKSKDGTLLTNVDEQLIRWKMHFMETIDNSIPYPGPSNDMSASTLVQLNTSAPSPSEIETAIKKLKNKKSPGFDRIPPEIIRYFIHYSRKFGTKKNYPTTGFKESL
ncbi:uncharacterized protein LOC135950029 [Calliphora vicina]|uniref:uncharacterized protein LOC135950029 n=1 Tax=Calliphora vicina TaxID=7373 RepID=UPI00325B9A1D